MQDDHRLRVLRQHNAFEIDERTGAVLARVVLSHPL
jgi:hypothetical protein